MSTTVWLIDDCALATKLTRARLAALQVDVQTFPSGDAALKAWVANETERPLSMLIDLNMPGLDGKETGRALRDHGYLGVMILHTTQPEDLKPGVLAAFGFDDSVTKPASKDDLRRVIADAIRARHRRSA